MWIRSQDKKLLINTDVVTIEQPMFGNYSGSPIFTYISGKFNLLGTYKSEERALEVLDMIESRIIKGDKFDSINRNKRVTKEFVFQMPEE